MGAGGEARVEIEGPGMEGTRSSSPLPGCVLVSEGGDALQEGLLGWQGLQNENKGLGRMILDCQQVSAAVCH